MPKIYRYYLKSVFWMNLFISGACAVVFTPGRDVWDIPVPSLSGFSVLFTTFGYVVTVFMHHSFSRKTKYMYFNKGISRLRLYLFGFLFNLLFVSVLHTIAAIWPD